jgi:ABC-type transport system involved in multi-copper enzyme maturation permease subunit
MLPGPVFNVELVTTARRARYYAIRFAYGMILLFFVVQTVGQWRGDVGALWKGGALSIAEMAATGRSIFATFTVFQGVAVLVLTPALVSGVVADEKRRKTLPYLMASRLSSAEIILGKLLARMLHVGIFLALGVPVMSLVSLFGGVEPAEVMLAYVGTLTTAVFLAALSILVSTLSRRPRDAGLQVYILELGWLFGPALVAHLVPSLGGRWINLYEWIAHINDPLRWSSPYAVLEALPAGVGGVGAAVVRMAALQSAFAAVLVLLAIAALRPLVRREGQGLRRLGRLAAAGRKLRWLPRPAVGDDAMLWKECHCARPGGMLRFLVGFVYLAVAAALVYTTYGYAVPAFAELFQHGYSSAEGYGARREFSLYLRVVCTLVYIVWCLGIASLAAAAVTSEREEDTWTSLITAPLSGEEILRAKMLGAIWGARAVGFLLAVLWLIGLAAGSVHPLGLVAVVIETTVFVWFAAALGVTFSLSTRSSVRAQAATMALLATINGLYLLCCIPVRPDTLFCAAGVTPMIEGISLMSYEDIAWMYANPVRTNENEAIATCLLAVLLYGAAALILTTRAFVSFDEKVDRPRRGWSGASVPGGKPRLALEDDDEGSRAC